MFSTVYVWKGFFELIREHLFRNKRLSYQSRRKYSHKPNIQLNIISYVVKRSLVNYLLTGDKRQLSTFQESCQTPV